MNVSAFAFDQNRQQLNQGQFQPQFQSPQIQQRQQFPQRPQINQVTCRDRIQRVQSLFQAQYNISNYERTEYCNCANRSQSRVDNNAYGRLCGRRDHRRNDYNYGNNRNYENYRSYDDNSSNQNNGISRDAIVGGVIGGVIGGFIGGMINK